MINSMKDRLSAITPNNKEELNQFRMKLMMELHEQESSRNLLEVLEQNPRKELREEKAEDQSPRSLFVARGDLNEATTRRLKSARDVRSLKLPSLEARKSEDYLEMLNDLKNSHTDIGPQSE